MMFSCANSPETKCPKRCPCDSFDLVTYFVCFLRRLEHPIKRQKLESKLDLNKSSRDAAALANNNSSSHSSRVARESPPSPAVAHDPYEFSDEASNAGNFPKHSLRTSRDDSFPRASPFGSKQVMKFSNDYLGLKC